MKWTNICEMDEFISLVELQRMLQVGISTLFPDRLWVKAEVASISSNVTGHCYLELVQNDESGKIVAKIKANIWRNNWRIIKSYFEEKTGSSIVKGMEILVEVEISYHELYGMSLIVSDINPDFSLGKKEETRKKTIKRLETEGYMDIQKELSLPALPYRFAIVSSQTAAGYGDFIRHLHENEQGFVFETKLYPAIMQGSESPESVVAAFERIQESGEIYDAVLLLRGGGSEIDLACFDDFQMCKAIALCPFPVLTAVGHDRDYHICDMVANKHLKTPTALADEILQIYIEEDSRILYYVSRMRLAFANRINAMESQIQNLQTRILSADPRLILKRGYQLAVDSSGQVLKSVSGIKKGDKLQLMFQDGKLDLAVESVKKS